MATTSLPSTTDGDMIIKQYNTLTINSGNVLTVSNRCRGLFIYVKGDCTINGQLSMDSRGPYVNPTVAGSSDSQIVNASGLKYWFHTIDNSGSEITVDGSWFNGAGVGVKTAIANQGYIKHADAITFVRQGAGNNTSGGTGQTGGGGQGGLAQSGGRGSGSHGSCFGGGSGAGGARQSTGGSGTAWGGPGGNATRSCGGCATGGGAGNPGGSGTASSGTGGTGGTGTGGFLMLVVGGNLTVGPTGSITARGANGGVAYCGANCAEYASGGGSGGGNIAILYRGSFTNNGNITAAGGSAGGSSSAYGSAGGNGSIQIRQIK